MSAHPSIEELEAALEQISLVRCGEKSRLHRAGMSVLSLLMSRRTNGDSGYLQELIHEGAELLGRSVDDITDYDQMRLAKLAAEIRITRIALSRDEE